MKKLFFLITISLVSLIKIYSQRILIDEKPIKYKNFFQAKHQLETQLISGYSFYLPDIIEHNLYQLYPIISGKIKWGLSNNYPFWKYLGIGFDTYLAYKRYKFNEPFIYLRQANEQSNESLKITTINLGIFLRIYFSKHGYKSGYYIDIIGTGSYNLTQNYILKIRSPNINFAQKAELHYKNLNFINVINYGPGVRIGFNMISLTSQYYFIPVLNKNYIFAPSYNFAAPTKNLTNFSVGIEINL